MQSWIPEIWQAAVIGLVVGVILGYLLLRLTKGSVKKQVQTEDQQQRLDEACGDTVGQLYEARTLQRAKSDAAP